MCRETALMETLGSVSITALLHRLIMLCAVMFETT